MTLCSEPMKLWTVWRWSVCILGWASVSLSVRDRNQSWQHWHFLFVSVPLVRISTLGWSLRPRPPPCSHTGTGRHLWGGRQDLKETHQRVTTTPQIFSGTHPLCTGGYNTQINISSHFPHNTSLTSHNRTTNTKVFTTTLSVINSPIMLCLIWWCRGENTTLDFETEASSCESQEFHSSTRFISADICSVQE